jgi:hypothetical protein
VNRQETLTQIGFITCSHFARLFRDLADAAIGYVEAGDPVGYATVLFVLNELTDVAVDTGTTDLHMRGFKSWICSNLDAQRRLDAMDDDDVLQHMEGIVHETVRQVGRAIAPHVEKLRP